MSTSGPRQVVQSVSGDGHTFTGHGNVYVTQHLVAPDSADRDVLDVLLSKVVDFWVDGVLAHSIHMAGLIALGKTTAPEAIEHPWARVLEVPGGTPERIPPDEPIDKIFEEAHRMLVVLGEPGSGKTTTLLEIARLYAARASDDVLRHQVPVVFNLSTWSSRSRTFTDWIVGELSSRYRVGKRTGRRLVKRKRLLFLLDGLDEMHASLRPGFIRALHEHIDADSTSGVVLTCRSREFATLGMRLKFGAALRIEPLNEEQVASYIQGSGGRLAFLQALLREDAEIREMARSPLMLSILSLTYVDAWPDVAYTPLAHGTGNNRRDQVFSQYVSRVVARRPGEFAEPEIRKRLGALATKMNENGQTVFALRDLQPSWLGTLDLVLYATITRVLTGVAVAAGMFGLLWGASYEPGPMDPGDAQRMRAIAASLLSWGVASGILAGTGDAWRFKRRRVVKPGFSSTRSLVLRAVFYFGCAFAAFQMTAAIQLYGHVFWVILGTGFSLTMLIDGGGLSFDMDVNLKDPLMWSWKSALRFGAAGGLLGGVFGVIVGALVDGDPLTNAPIYGYLGLAAGVSLGGLRRAPIHIERDGAVFDRVMLRDLVFASGVLMASVVFWYTLTESLAFSIVHKSPVVSTDAIGRVIPYAILTGGLGLIWFGGLSLVRHYFLRMLLVRSKTLAPRTERWLDHCASLILLQKVGSGYAFIHRLLLDYFARNDLNSDAARTEPVRT